MTTDEAPAPNVIEALRRVMRDLPAIGKDHKASPQQGGYAYRGIEDITRGAQMLMARHGVVFVPSVQSWEEAQFSINNKPWSDQRLTVTYTVYGPGGPEDRITVGPIAAIGRDNSDKGTNKAITQAYKYALLQTLCIADAKDDADGSTHEADTAPRRISSPALGPAPVAPDEGPGESAAPPASPNPHAATVRSLVKGVPKELRGELEDERQRRGLKPLNDPTFDEHDAEAAAELIMPYLERAEETNG